MAIFTVFHADHGITPEQMEYIQSSIATSVEGDGFFIAEDKIPAELGTVPCGLYGPAMGDQPVGDDAVVREKRGDRPYADRMTDLPFRDVDYVQSIGIREGDKFTLFTVYGGPLAPQHPEDPSNREVEASKTFWAQHALSRGDA